VVPKMLSAVKEEAEELPETLALDSNGVFGEMK